MLNKTNPDPTIYAVISLLRSRMASSYHDTRWDASESKHLNLKKIDWQRFIAFSSAHFVLQALVDPLLASDQISHVPRDVVSFLTAFCEANAKRNALMRKSTIEIAAALNKVGEPPVVLKGGAFLLDDEPHVACWRFMSDIDLLVSANKLSDSVEALNSLGYVAADSAYDPATHAHFSPLISPCGTFSVELHTRLFGLEDYDICPKELRSKAQVYPDLQTTLLKPQMKHRLAHLMAHSQLHNLNYIVRRLVLKDFLDVLMLQREHGDLIDFREILSLFKTPRNAKAIIAFLAAWESFSHTKGVPDLRSSDKRWARAATARLSRNGWRNWLQLPGDLVALEFHRLTNERRHLNRRLKQISDPALLANVLQKRIGKERQRLWS